MYRKCKEIICVATDTELLSEPYYRRLWLATRNRSVDISRRAWLDEIADCLRDFRGEITYVSGDLYPIPLPDDVFNDEEMRWLSKFIKADPSGSRPAIRSRALERLRLLDLYFRIRHKNIAQHFWK